MTTVAIRNQQKVSAYRQRMKKAGMRPVQIWVTDTRNKNLKRKMKLESKMVAQNNSEQEILDFIELVNDFDE